MTQATRLHYRGMGSLILEPWCHVISCCCRLFWLLTDAPLPAKKVLSVISACGLIGWLLNPRGHLPASEGATEHLECPSHVRSTSVFSNCSRGSECWEGLRGREVDRAGRMQAWSFHHIPEVLHQGGSDGLEGWVSNGLILKPRSLLRLRHVSLSRCALFMLEDPILGLCCFCPWHLEGKISGCG